MGKGWNRGFQKVHGLVKTLEISKYFFSLEQAVKETGKHKRPSVSSYMDFIHGQINTTYKS